MTEEEIQIKPKTNKVHFVKLIMAFFVLCIALVVALKILYNKQDDKTKTALNVLGLSGEPWNKRADAAIKTTIDKNVAQSIISIAHPTGKNAVLSSVTSAELGDDRIQVTIMINWKGGVIGGSYETQVDWVFNKTSHELAKVSKDNSVTGVNSDNQSKLNEYFLLQVYPPVKHNIN